MATLDHWNLVPDLTIKEIAALAAGHDPNQDRETLSKSSRKAFASVSRDFHPRGCIKRQAALRSPLLNPLYCAIRSNNNLTAWGDSLANDLLCSSTRDRGVNAPPPCFIRFFGMRDIVHLPKLDNQRNSVNASAAVMDAKSASIPIQAYRRNRFSSSTLSRAGRFLIPDLPPYNSRSRFG